MIIYKTYYITICQKLIKQNLSYHILLYFIQKKLKKILVWDIRFFAIKLYLYTYYKIWFNNILF